MPGLLLLAVSTAAVENQITLAALDGTPVARVTLKAQDIEVPGYLAVDLGVRAPLLLHTRSAAAIGIQSTGEATVTFQESRVQLADLEVVARDLEPLETLTREHAATLDNLPVIGVLGLPAFSGYRLSVAFDRGMLSLAPARATGDAENGSWLALEPVTYGYWLTARGPGDVTLRTRFVTSEADTRVSAPRAADLGFPGGDLPTVILGGVNLAEYAVFRPSDFSGFPAPRPDISLGTRCLSAFELEIRVDERLLRLTPVRPPDPPLHEQRFFVARAANNIAGVREFLASHGETRLADEASETLLLMELDDPDADHGDLQEAMAWIARTAPPERRAERLVRVADDLIALEEERDDALALAMNAVEIGRRYQSADLNATAVHQLNAREGLVALLRGDHRQARRMLLSAVFGLPQDAYVNFWLGRLYEETGQRTRAWSRYLIAALVDEPPIGALRSLSRLNNDPEFRTDFTLPDAQQLLEGRIPRLGLVEQFDPEKGMAAPALIELFTSVDAPATQAAEIAFEALIEYYAPAETVLVQHHVDDALATAAARARAEQLGVDGVPALYVNGALLSRAGGDDRQATDVLTRYRESIAALGPFSVDTSGRRLGLAIDGRRVTVEVSIPTAARRVSRLHVLACESVAMLIGPSKRPLHRNVVRGTLTPPGGTPLDALPTDAPLALDLDVAALSDAHAERLGAIDPPPAMKPILIDRDQLLIVALLETAPSGKLIAVAAQPVPAAEGGAGE